MNEGNGTTHLPATTHGPVHPKRTWRTHLVRAFLLLAPLATLAQDRAELETTARGYITTLTSPEFHGRGYVSNGDGLAADWIAAQFARIGLKPVKKDFFQPFQFTVNSFPEKVELTIDGQELRAGEDFIVDPASGSASGEYALVHLSLADLLTPERRAMTMGVLAGQAAYLHPPTTTDADTLRLHAELERELAVYVPVVRQARGKLTWSVAQDALPHPIIEVASPLLHDSVATVRLSVKNQLQVRRPARNVLGMIPGKSRKWIMITAHYDHLGRMGPDVLFPGANDNASGVAMLLTLAEWFKKHKPRHNILFAAFAGEEAGLLGSQWCAVDRPIPWADVRLLVNLDILGTGDDGITVVNATAQKAAYDKLVAINTAKSYLPEVKSRGPACNSDHCPFVERGIPGIFIYTMGGVAHYHDVHDKAETLPLTRYPELHALLREFIAAWK
jgi:aminopeptidase YwaD